MIAFAIDRHPDPVADSERAQRLLNPGFGRVFTDHMAMIRWSDTEGWHDARITARVPLTLDPATAVFHYAQEIFEGMKAYGQADGSAALFRPDANARRFAASARRLAMPELPQADFVESVRALVHADRAWIPTGEDGALYLRPFMIATEVFLGVRPATEYLYMVIASSVGAYWKGGARAISVWVSDHYTRAAPGGTGAAKCGGNYAGSLAAQAEAMENGCDQVVFLDAVDRRYVEELGGMNVFFVHADGAITTPPLSGTILEGITRDAILTLARDAGMTVREAHYSVDDLRSDARSGRLTEAFACGTAAVVTAIGSVCGSAGTVTIGDGGVGPVTRRLGDGLIAIQRGVAPDAHGWMHPID